MTDYISTADTAKAMRLALRDAFPDVTFSVRSKVYSGGSSVDVRWTDGPTKAEVDAVVGIFSSRGFDGSIDLGYTIAHYALPSGKIVGTKTSGSAGSGGYVPAHDDGPIAGATLVRFGAGFVFTTRDHSPAVLARLEDWIRTRYAVTDPDFAPPGAWRHAEEAIAVHAGRDVHDDAEDGPRSGCCEGIAAAG